MKPRTPLVYLPIELRSREFDSKIMLAARLAEMGYPSLIGQQWALASNFFRLPPATVFFKSFNKIHQPAMIEARKAGHRVVLLEEELLGQTQERGINWNCTHGVFDLADLVIANGEFESGVLRKISGNDVRIEIAGNGRIELLKPQYRKFFERQIDELRTRFGDFVLVNTNFGIHNSIWNVEEVTKVQISAGLMKPDDPDSVRVWDDYIVWEKANMDGMQAAIIELSRRRPAQTIVIRPHPAEDMKKWDGLFTGYKNIFVVREGSHVPWTLACKVLMHTCCTTGFEAFVAGTPAFSLTPLPSWLNDSVLSSRINPQFTDPHELIDAVEKALDGEVMQTASVEAEKFVWNTADHNAFTRIAELLIEELPPRGEIRLPPLSSYELEDRLKIKFDVTAQECADTLSRAAKSLGSPDQPESIPLQDGIFLIVPASRKGTISISPPLLDSQQAVAAMDAAFRARDLHKILEIFKTNLSEIDHSSPCWFLAGVALFELGRHAEALQHFQKAEATAGPNKNFQLLFMLAVVYRQLGKTKKALDYAEQAHKAAPTDQRAFDFYSALLVQSGGKPPKRK